jgi:hypothetical protein
MYPAGLKILCDGYVMRVLIWRNRLPPVGFANDRSEVEASRCKGYDYSILCDGYVIAIPNTWMGWFTMTLVLALSNQM